jgi:hypothetical protein
MQPGKCNNVMLIMCARLHVVLFFQGGNSFSVLRLVGVWFE